MAPKKSLLGCSIQSPHRNSKPLKRTSFFPHFRDAATPPSTIMGQIFDLDASSCLEIQVLSSVFLCCCLQALIIEPGWPRYGDDQGFVLGGLGQSQRHLSDSRSSYDGRHCPGKVDQFQPTSTAAASPIYFLTIVHFTRWINLSRSQICFYWKHVFLVWHQAIYKTSKYEFVFNSFKWDYGLRL